MEGGKEASSPIALKEGNSGRLKAASLSGEVSMGGAGRETTLKPKREEPCEVVMDGRGGGV